LSRQLAFGDSAEDKAPSKKRARYNRQACDNIPTQGSRKQRHFDLQRKQNARQPNSRQGYESNDGDKNKNRQEFAV
jgi:hypothetical protein